MRPCTGCRVKPVAYCGRAFCYDCVPRARTKPWRCKRCGTGTDYYSAGLCRRCHRSGPVRESCLDCLAWGVTRRNGWLCQACRGWRRRFDQPRECPSCRRCVVVNARGYCRLCCRQANLVRPQHRSIDVLHANGTGQQLFLVDLFRQKRLEPQQPEAPPTAWPGRYPVDFEQMLLFDVIRDLNAGRQQGFPAPPLPDLTAALEHAVIDHASRHGWGEGLIDQTCAGIRVLLTVQDTPGARITYSQVDALRQLPWAGVQPVVEILVATGMLDDDRAPPLHDWFATHTTGLPEPMTGELRQWFLVLRDGGTTSPRTRPCTISTVRLYVAAVTPALRAWAEAGHESLREISRRDVLDVLPTDDAVRRTHTITALRSLFRLLRARHAVFANPITRIKRPQAQTIQPLPMELRHVREAINSAHPARAALAVLIAFHAPRNSHLRAARLTDLRDGRLLLPDHTVLLAEPVRERLAAWLDERADRWPDTINPHLFINKNTAVRTCPVSSGWISATIGIPARTIRQDRILDEALATRGDIRRLCDLFGLTVGTATRYASPAEQDERFSSPTRGPG